MCVYVCVCDCVQAISNATEEIERKFSEMMRNENFDILEFYGRQKKLFEPARGPVDVTQSFAVLVKPAIADAALAAANSKKVLSLSCPFLSCPAAAAASCKSCPTSAAQADEDDPSSLPSLSPSPSSSPSLSPSLSSAAEDLNQDKIRQIVCGLYHCGYRTRWPANLPGDTELEAELKMRMRLGWRCLCV